MSAITLKVTTVQQFLSFLYSDVEDMVRLFMPYLLHFVMRLASIIEKFSMGDL